MSSVTHQIVVPCFFILLYLLYLSFVSLPLCCSSPNICHCQNSGIEKAFLFDVVSKIYIATDSSPVDMQSYELCCDMIDVVIDVSCIYGWVRFYLFILTVVIAVRVGLWLCFQLFLSFRCSLDLCKFKLYNKWIKNQREVDFQLTFYKFLML